MLSDKSGGVLAAHRREGRAVRQRDRPRHRSGGASRSSEKGFAFSPRRARQQRRDRAPHQQRGRKRRRHGQPHPQRPAGRPRRQAIEQLARRPRQPPSARCCETHNMLRADTTALFERLREANIMLQEVLSGSHENMSALENTLMLRVSEFVTAMNEVTAATGDATGRVEQHHRRVPRDHRARASPISASSRSSSTRTAASSAKAVELIERSNRADRTDASTSAASQLESLVADARHPHRGYRAAAQALLRPARRDRSRPPPAARRDIARVVSESSAEGSARHRRAVRARARERRGRAPAAPPKPCARSTSRHRRDRGDMFREASERFAEMMRGMKQMAAEMQRELEATRAELRRGIFELPQETAESAAQMRRVIVDQIEALAELNRIVARHGRSLDAVEPAPRAAARGRRRWRASRRRAARPRRAREPPPRAARRVSEPASFAPAAAAPQPTEPRRAGRRHRRRPRLAHRSAQPRLARGRRAANASPREPSPRERRAQRGAHAAPFDRVARFAVGRHRAHDRPRRRRRSVGPLQARRAQRLHPPALHLQGQKAFDEIRRSIAPTANSSRRSTATSASSSGCSTRSRATTAARWWRAPISPRKPARSTPCWRTRPAASTERRRKHGSPDELKGCRGG